MTRFSLLPSMEPLVLSTRKTEGWIELAPQRPCVARYLFLDGIVDGLLVKSVDVGCDRAFESWGGVPARIFELRGLAATLTDAAGAIARGDVARLEINTEATWPLQLDLPPLNVGYSIRVYLDAKHCAAIYKGGDISIHAAFAVEKRDRNS